MKKLLIVACILACGCMTKQRHIEGTHLAIGAYLPFEDALYGVELLQFTSGAMFSTATNTPCTFERDYAATNTYFWGMVETRETTKTKIEVKK